MAAKPKQVRCLLWTGSGLDSLPEMPWLVSRGLGRAGWPRGTGCLASVLNTAGAHRICSLHASPQALSCVHMQS